MYINRAAAHADITCIGGNYGTKIENIKDLTRLSKKLSR